MIDARETPDWYRGFQRWEPSKDGENVVAMRPLLAEMIGAGVVAADSEEAEWKGGGAHPAWDVRVMESLSMSSTRGITRTVCSGSLLRRRRANTIPAKCTESSWWCSVLSSLTTSTCATER